MSEPYLSHCSTERPAENQSDYEQDFCAWLTRQVDLLRTGQINRADIDNIIEELEALGRSERNSLSSRLEELLLHLLKWRYQPDRRNRSWRDSIDKQRHGLEDILETSPSLRHSAIEILPKVYGRARRRASNQTGLAQATFPTDCPFQVDQILDEAFLPEI